MGLDFLFAGSLSLLITFRLEGVWGWLCFAASQLVGEVAFYKLTFFTASQLEGVIALYKLTFFATSQLVGEVAFYKLTTSYNKSA